MRRTLISRASAGKGTVAAAATSTVPKSILIVGGGPTAAIAAASLKEICRQRNVVPPAITVMDKARGLGGRMSTHRASGAAAGAVADTGAQYLTQLSENSGRWFEKLKAAGVIVPMQGEIVGQKFGQKSTANYVAPQGISSVVRSIAASSEAKFLPSHRVVALNVVDNPNGEDDEDEEDGDASPAVTDKDGNVLLPPPKRQWSVLVEKITKESFLAAAAEKAAKVAAAAQAAAGATAPSSAPAGKMSPSGSASVTSKSSSSPSATSASASVLSAPVTSSASSSASAAAAASASQPPLEKFLFDAVVLTCPVPQILSLEGDVKALLEGAEVVDGLKQVTYSSRYSLILYYGPGDWAALNRALPHGAIGKYCDRSESDVIRFVAFDSLKRQRVPKEFSTIPSPDASTPLPPAETCPSIVVHTSVEFGSMYVDTDPLLVEPVIREHLKRMFPGLPEPVETKCHRWRYSQVMRGYRGHQPFGYMIKGAKESKGGLSDSHGGKEASTNDEIAGAVLAVDDPPLVLAGDAFSSSHFDGCVVSGEKSASLLLELLASTLQPLAPAPESAAKEDGEEEDASADDDGEAAVSAAAVSARASGAAAAATAKL